MKGKRNGTLLLAAGAALLLGAFGLAGYNLWDESRAAAAADGAMTVLNEMIAPAPEVSSDASGEVRIPDYILDPYMDLPVVEIDGNRYVGYLEIPVLELSLPVLETWSYPNLKLSACRYTGSPYRDNMVVAAHNYRQHFGHLKELVEGDEVRFTDMDGNVFVYAVAELEQLAPQPAEAMLEGDWDLSLFTCTLGGQYRTTVRCVRTYSREFAEAAEK